MRYLLVIVGVLGLIVGVQELYGSPPQFKTFGAAYLVAGAVFFAVGGATFDMVAAIRQARDHRTD